MNYKLSDIIHKFAIDADISPYGNGHINDTYIAESNPRYIMQKINSNVFKNPYEVMENIVNVTEHLKQKIAENGGDTSRETLRVIKTIDGDTLYLAEDGNYFRMYNYIENATSYDAVENPQQFTEAARAFGKFQNMLADFPADKLHETIPNFHDTRKRFENLKKAIAEDKMGRLESVKAEVEFALAHEAEVGTIVDAIADGSVPLRVTHNDTKLNNVMLDNVTGEGVCVIDLDTVMPGSLLYDYGDALRFGASTGAEDETDLSKINFSLELFEAFTKGFLGEVGSKLTPRERELLPFGAKIMTFECGIRFLTDYLEGDTYFKIHREHHNLDRCRTQFKLVADMEAKAEEMQKIVAKY
ncbi:MAG: aminoglycoside phosphotransferase family protein [Eubacteriales bacterium]|nr:aminoglycoside phosphotransferase family protein [Eubacteriales bacterium]